MWLGFARLSLHFDKVKSLCYSWKIGYSFRSNDPASEKTLTSSLRERIPGFGVFIIFDLLEAGCCLPGTHADQGATNPQVMQFSEGLELHISVMFSCPRENTNPQIRKRGNLPPFTLLPKGVSVWMIEPSIV